MRIKDLSKTSKIKLIILILVISITIGLFSDILVTCIEKLIYQENYYDLVMEYSTKYCVPPELVFAIINVESNYDKNAVSSAGAIGLMQIMPSTYEWIASIFGDSVNVSRLYIPQVNIEYGTYYLQYLYEIFDCSWEKAIIAYNWGMGNFMRFIEEHGYTEGDFGSIPVSETRNYVRKVLYHWEKYKEIYNNQ